MNSLSLQPSLAYYIRKLLRQSLNRLKSVVAPGAAITADSFNDLDAVLESLYLEPDEINDVVKELEKLTLVHQGLAERSGIYRQEVEKCEERLFWLLGFKYLPQERPGKILIVDDNVTLLKLMVRGLTREGYETYTTGDGSSMMPLFHAFRPDLVLMDVNMPGVNGYDACKALKTTEYGARIPVLFISSANGATDRAKALAVGAADYITKPFKLKDILAKIESHIKQGAMAV